ncbi:MAG: glycosyltransferase family 4 protein [Pseudomonadota bacterium]
MKVVLYSHLFLPKIGGREIAVNNLAGALFDIGIDVRVVGPRVVRGKAAVTRPFPVHRYPRAGRSRLQNQDRSALLQEWQMAAALTYDRLRWGADIIHAHSSFPGASIAARSLSVLPGARLVVTPHGIDINTDVEAGYGMRLNETLARKIDRSLKTAAAVTAISDGVRENLRRAGVPQEKLWRVDNGIDVDRFRDPVPVNVRKVFGIPDGMKLLLSVGNYHPLKGQGVIIEALKSLGDRIPDLGLVIIGRGTEALRDQIDKAGLSQRVFLTGELPFKSSAVESSADAIDLIAAFYQQCDLYVAASKAEGAEGLSLAVLDSFAAGIPLIATAISGNRDVVVDGVNGLLVAPGDASAIADAIARLLRDPVLCAALAAQGQRRADELSWRSVAKAYVKVYEAVLRKGEGVGSSDWSLRGPTGENRER